MENFINENLVSIIVFLVVCATAIVLCFVAKGRYRKAAKQILLSLVIAAENKFGGGTGKIKFSYVAEKLYEKMPVIVQILFTAEDIADMIEVAVEDMKEYLAENPETPVDSKVIS